MLDGEPYDGNLCETGVGVISRSFFGALGDCLRSGCKNLEPVERSGSLDRVTVAVEAARSLDTHMGGFPPSSVQCCDLELDLALLCIIHLVPTKPARKRPEPAATL